MNAANPAPFGPPSGDPLCNFPRALTKLRTVWMQFTYPFLSFGAGVSIHHSCSISRPACRHISLGNSIYLGEDVWLNVVLDDKSSTPKLDLGEGCKIGRRSVLSVRNHIRLEPDVLLAPGVLIMDHNHEYRDPRVAIHAQGVTRGGSITIGRNSWIGYGAVICSGDRDLSLGRNSVVGANSVVTQSFPPFSVIAGNPARLVRYYDEDSGEWRRVQNIPESSCVGKVSEK